MSKAPVLDLSGVPCPVNSARALIRLEGMAPGAELRLLVDDGEPIRNVPPALEEQGHAIVEKSAAGKQWSLLVRRGDS